jgi:hypothetical protein
MTAYPRAARLGASVLLAILAAASLAACGSNAAPNPGGNQGATASPDTTAGESQGGPDGGSDGGSGGGGSGPNPAPAYPADPESYTKAAVAAWASRNIARLDQLEVDNATLHTMYDCNGCYDIHFVLIGECDGAAGSSYCLFYNGAGDELRLRVSNPALGQARAIGTGSIFDQMTFPSDDKAYAQKALDAWLGRDDVRLKLLTQNLVSANVDAKGADPHGEWTFAGSEGAAGSLYLTWHNPAGHKLTFRFTNGPAAPTLGPASQHRITEIIYMP